MSENKTILTGRGGQISTPFIGDIGLGSCVQKSQIQKCLVLHKRKADR